MGLPDFKTMTRDEIATWLMENDTSEWMTTAQPGPSGRFVQVDAEGNPVNQVVTVKMPGDMVARLDEHAGRDREGRSGIIRQAVVEWLERHGDVAA